MDKKATMGTDELIKHLVQSIDNRDVDTFVTFLTDDVMFRFGNAEPVNGKENVGSAVGGFFESIVALEHDVFEIVEQRDTVICHGVVTYTRHDSSTLRVPFANIFKISENLIKEYRMLMDISELYGRA